MNILLYELTMYLCQFDIIFKDKFTANVLCKKNERAYALKKVLQLCKEFSSNAKILKVALAESKISK